MSALGYQVRRWVPRRLAPRPTLDRRLYQLVNSLPHTYRGDLYIGILSDLGEGLGWWLAGAWLVLLDGSRGRRAALTAAAASLAASRVAQDLLKPFFRRRRPWERGRSVVVGRRTFDTSFPSGHTAASFAAATVLAGAYPKAGLPLYVTATGVGISRIFLGHHFPTDVAAGAVLGTFIGLLGVRRGRGRGRRPRPASPR